MASEGGGAPGPPGSPGGEQGEELPPELRAKKVAGRSMIVQLERLRLRRAPPRDAPQGVPLPVSLQLCDDMGRGVSVQGSLLEVTASAWRQTGTGDGVDGGKGPPVSCTVGVPGGGDGPAGFSPGTSTCEVALVLRGGDEDGGGGEVVVEFTARTEYNPRGRVSLGLHHTVLSARAGPISLHPTTPPGYDPNLAPSAPLFRALELGAGEEVPLVVHEDARAHGHGTEATWGTCWDSGVVLAGCLALCLGDGEGSEGRRRRAVEVGCGGGVSGLALAAHGWEVVLTDGEEAALRLAERNAAANGLEGRATTQVLWWGDHKAADELSPPLDAVIAADVAYKESLFKPLVDTLSRLSGPDTVVLLAFRRRSGGVKGFFDLVAKSFEVHAIDGDAYHPYYRAADVSVFRLKKRPPAGPAPPEHEVTVKEGEGVVEVALKVPALESAAGVKIELVGGTALEVILPGGAYGACRVPLPEGAEAGACKVKFSKKKRVLTAVLSMNSK